MAPGKPNRTLIFLIGIIATILIGWVLQAGAAILQPLVIALLLAVMLQPIVRGLARFKIPPAVTVITLAALLLLGLLKLGLMIQANVTAFVSPTSGAPPPPDALSDGTEPPRAGGWQLVKDKLRERLESSEISEEMIEYVVEMLDTVDVRGIASEAIGGTFGFSRALLLVVIYMLFIFAEQAVFRRKILSVSGHGREDAKEMLDTIGRGIQRYLGVKTVTSLATGFLCYSVLVALEIPYAPLFGFLTYLLNYIPTFGSIAAGIFPTMTAFAIDSSWEKAAIVIVAYLAVNITLGSIIEPKILGRELNLSPLVVVVSVVVWAGLWGVVGTFLAVPLTSTLQIILASSDTTRPIAVLLSSGPPAVKKKRGTRAPTEEPET